VIGIKVWVFKGEIISKHDQPLLVPAIAAEAPAPDVPSPKPAPKKRRLGTKNVAAS
jgi:hypothetical protein